MRRFFGIAGTVAVCLILVGSSVQAASNPSGSLYAMEQGEWDNQPVEADAAGDYPGSGTPAVENWTHKEGGGTWTGVYGGGNGWVAQSSTGDLQIKIEADVEMYAHDELTNNQAYFHIGNVYDLSSDNKKVVLNGTLTSNNGQFWGLSFTTDPASQGKDDSQVDESTGVVTDAMKAEFDTTGEMDNPVFMDAKFEFAHDGGTWETPVNYGYGSDQTQWGLFFAPVDAGTTNYKLKVTMLPETDQPDGDYYLDPMAVHTPQL